VKEKAKQFARLQWYNRRVAAGVYIVVLTPLVYPLALHALGTGSLQQYVLILFLVLFIGTQVGNVLHKKKA